MAASDAIPNYDFLQFVNSNFADLVSHYVNMWQGYHQTFAAAAISLCLIGGLVWVAVVAFKAPKDKLQAALGVFAVVIFTGLLLQKGQYAIGPGGTQVGLTTGAGWSIKIVGNVYQLFKSALDRTNSNAALELAINNAFHVTDQNTLSKFLDSPVRPMYEDYIAKCQPALSALAGESADTRKLGQAVGLYGSAGINQAEVAKLSKETYEKLVSGDKTAAMSLNALFFGSTGIDFLSSYMTNKEREVKDDATRAQQMLAKIPADANPFDGTSNGYMVPTENFWLQHMFKKGTDGEPEFESISTGDNDMYRYGGYSKGSEVPAHQANLFYPKDCLQMYMLVTQSVENWTQAISREVPVSKRPAWMRDQLSTQTQMIKRVGDKLEQEKAYKAANPNMPTFSGVRYREQGADWGFGVTADEIMSSLQAIGSKFKQWMLTFKIPAMINGCAMLAGLLVVLFPLICVFSVFIKPAYLVTYFKLLVFTFTVPLINNMVLTMSATLLALNEEVLNGLNSGDYSENFTVLISASSAQYIIFMALTTIEIIIAKMLIWDDVKGLSGFNPGGAATGAALTGAAVVGTAMKFASMALGGPGRIAGALRGSGGTAGSPGAGGPGTPRGLSGSYGQANVNVNYSPPASGSNSYASAGSRLSNASRPPTPPTGGTTGGPKGKPPGSGTTRTPNPKQPPPKGPPQSP